MTTSTPNTTSNSRPWLWVVLTFIVMIAFWSVVVTIAFKKMPASVAIESSSHPADAHD